MLHPVIAPLIDTLAQGVAPVKNLMKARGNLHHANLRPSDIHALKQADIIIAVSPELPEYFGIWLKKHRPAAKVIFLNQYEEAQLLPGQHSNTWPEKTSHPKANAAQMYDVHFWLDPLRMANILPKLARDMAQAAPTYAESFILNANQLALHLRAVTYPQAQNIIDSAKEAAKILPAGAASIPYITRHDVFYYAFERFKLIDYGYLSQHEQENLSAARLRAILNQAPHSHVRCIITDTADYLTKRFKTLANAEIKIINPSQPISSQDIAPQGWFKNDYDRFIAHMAAGFASCLH